MSYLKRWWKYSSLRFYILNAKCNYSFWFFCKKEYKTIEYFTYNSLRRSPKKISKKRFIGYRYKGHLYLDNPGLSIKERDVWEAWKKKGLL